MHVDATVVVQEAELPELIHDEADAGARGANHLGEHVLTDLRNERVHLAFFLEMCHEQQHPSQPLLAGIEQVIHQVLLDPKAPR